MPHRLITTTHQLEQFCHTLEHVSFVAIDTEFIREKTYYPQVCLIQVAGPEAAYAIDPLAEGINLTPLFRLLANEQVLKVFHAGRQDVEIFFHLTGNTPSPAFDTQIAAQVCGFGESVSYSELVSRLLSISIDKASRYTDWAKRPLTDRQITYALEDVIYLRGAYEKIKVKLERNGRESWIAEDMAILTDPATYTLEVEDAWKRLKTGNLKPKQLAVLREAAAWREEEARARNIPRGRILRDETLLEIAASCPRDVEALRHIRGIGSHFSPKWTDALLGCVETALMLPPEEWPTVTYSRRSTADSDLVALLQLLLKLKCSEHGIVPRLVAGKDDLEAMASGDYNIPVMQGWRHALFGQSAQQLINGELKIHWDAKQKKATY